MEEATLSDEDEEGAREGSIVILPVTVMRSGWNEAAQRLRESDGDRLLDEPTATRFDQEEWSW